MKRIVLVTYERAMNRRYKEQFRYFFGDTLEIQGVTLVDGIPAILSPGDLYVVSFPDVAEDIYHLLPEDASIVYINRTFYKRTAAQLATLPPGAPIKMVDFGPSFTLDTVGILNELGYRGRPIELVDIEARDPADIVIDLEWYCISVETLIRVCDILGVYGQEIGVRLYSYSQEIELANLSLVDTIINYWKMKSQWDVAMNMIDDGVIILDEFNTVVYHNQNVVALAKQEGKSVGIPLKDEHFHGEFWDRLAGHSDADEAVEVKQLGKKYLLSKKYFHTFGGIAGYAVILKETTLIEKLESSIRINNAYKGFATRYTFDSILGDSRRLRESIRFSRKIAATELSVLITGESGTGKELFAQSIHNESQRSAMPFVAINCAALPAELLESELFGYEEGSFTGAKRGGKMGLFELAHRGSLFLDEISEIPMQLQAKLLRVLQEREVYKVGGNKIIPVDVRIIASSNEDLEKLIQRRRFRHDLFYRLNVLNVDLPPLAERDRDVLLLARSFLGESSKRLSEQAEIALLRYSWPGNVRELKNCVQHMLLSDEEVIPYEALPAAMRQSLENAQEAPPEGLPGLMTEDVGIINTITENLAAVKMGRRRLHKLLQERGYDISEYRLRKLLDYMQEHQIL